MGRLVCSQCAESTSARRTRCRPPALAAPSVVLCRGASHVQGHLRRSVGAADSFARVRPLGEAGTTDGRLADGPALSAARERTAGCRRPVPRSGRAPRDGTCGPRRDEPCSSALHAGRHFRPVRSVLAARPLLPGPPPLGGGFLKGVHDLLADAHPDGVVMGAGGGGVHADQGQIRPPLAGCLGDHAFRQCGEDAGIPSDPEAAVDRRPRTELTWRLPPLAGAQPPDHPLELLPQPRGVRAVFTSRQERIDQLPLLVGELPATATASRVCGRGVRGDSGGPRRSNRYYRWLVAM